MAHVWCHVCILFPDLQFLILELDCASEITRRGRGLQTPGPTPRGSESPCLETCISNLGPRGF